MIRVVMLLSVLALTGCDDGGDTPRGLSTFHITVDGRTIPCVSAYRGGVTCDWSAK